MQSITLYVIDGCMTHTDVRSPQIMTWPATKFYYRTNFHAYTRTHIKQIYYHHHWLTENILLVHL